MTRIARRGPPSVALRLLAMRIPEPDREYLIGDLVEAFAARADRDGEQNARRWFWSETVQVLISRWPSPSIRVGHSPSEESMDTIVQSMRVAARALVRAPALTALVIGTLALGIGATTSVYSVARAALFARPPFPDSDQLVTVWEREKDGGASNVGFFTFQDLARESRVFASAAAMGYWTPTISNGQETTRLSGQRVSWTFFDVLGVKPMLGRGFVEEEDRRGSTRVVVLSHKLWSTRFGADSSIVGRDIQVNESAFRVAGVLPPEFESLLSPGAELWAPLGYDATLSYSCRSCRHLRMVARLRDQSTPRTATGHLDGVYARLKETFPNEYAGTGLSLVPVHEYVVRKSRPAMLALLGAVGLVALIACFNAANLLLSRALRRENEFAVRVALGASRARLGALLAWEGTFISVAAAALGTLLALLGVNLLVGMAPEGVPRLDQVRIDGGALAFALMLALVTGLTASLLPAWALLRQDVQGGIRSGARSLAGLGRHRLRSTLVAVEVALAVMLVSGTAALVGSVSRLLAVDTGFETSSRLTMELDLSGAYYADSGRAEQTWRAVVEGVSAVPGVRAAALASQIPLGGNVDMYGMHLSGGNPAEDPAAMRYAVTPGYFDTMGIPLVAGRLLTNADLAGAPEVVLLNETAARRLFPSGAAIGRQVQVGGSRPISTVVGVVGNTLHRGLDDEQEMQVYLPSSQWGEEGAMRLVVHTSVPAESTLPAIRNAVRQAGAGIAITNAATFERLVDLVTADRRFALALFAGFAVVALALAMAGLYGVLSATVVERTREIGVRTALGAQRGSILALVVGRGMVLTGLGLVVGLFATWGSTRIISTLLFGVSASEPYVLGVVVGTLGAAAMLACALPAWRASRVDPVIALRG